VKIIKEQLKLPLSQMQQPKSAGTKKLTQRDSKGQLRPAHVFVKKAVARLRIQKMKRTAGLLFLAVQVFEIFISLSGSL